MKKLFLLAIAFVTFSIAQAQISKGSVLLGGGISIFTQKVEGMNPSYLPYSVSSFSVSPSIGVAIKDNLIYGGALSYSYSKMEQTNSSNPNTDEQTNRYGIGGFVRKYFPLSGSFYLFGEMNLGFQYIDGTRTDYQSYFPPQVYTTKSTGWSVHLGLNPGIAFAVRPKFFLEAGLGNIVSVNYSQVKQTTTGQTSATSFSSKSSSVGFSSSASGSIPLSIGFRFILPSKK